jgi:hypothetical protein
MNPGGNNIEGRLKIALVAEGGGVSTVSIGSTRPFQTPKIFTGKPVDEMLNTLPLLYSVCGTAQACAAVEACEQALGIEQEPLRREARHLLVWFETAKEHLWRILLDWPGFLGGQPLAQGVGESMTLMKAFRQALFSGADLFQPGCGLPDLDPAEPGRLADQLDGLLVRHVYGWPLSRWQGISGKDEFLQWTEESSGPAARMVRHLVEMGWEGIGSSPVPPLPELSGEFLEKRLNSQQVDAFICAPDIDGACYETSPYTRSAGEPLLKALEGECHAGLLPRFAARLLELARIPDRLRQGIGLLGTGGVERTEGDPDASGRGLAQVEAARGRLVHRVELESGRISNYRILAPTEWNFHPDGVLARGLATLKAGSEDELREQAALLVNAIDPCVGYELEIC